MSGDKSEGVRRGLEHLVLRKEPRRGLLRRHGRVRFAACAKMGGGGGGGGFAAQATLHVVLVLWLSVSWLPSLR